MSWEFVRLRTDCHGGLTSRRSGGDDTRWEKPIIWSAAEVQPLDFGSLKSEVKDRSWVIAVLILYPDSVHVNEFCQVLSANVGLRYRYPRDPAVEMRSGVAAPA